MGAGAVLAPYESAPVFDGLADDPEGDSFKADMLRWLAWTSFKEPARQRARFGGALGSRFARFSMNVKRKWRKWRKWRAASSCKPCRTCRTRRADWMPLMAIAALEPGCPQAEAAPSSPALGGSIRRSRICYLRRSSTAMPWSCSQARTFFSTSGSRGPMKK